MSELPPVAQRANQARVILDGYGLERSDRVGFIPQELAGVGTQPLRRTADTR
jgi:hypothetical protein